MKKILFSLALLGAVLPAMARTWTNSSGKTVQADFVKLTGDEGSEKIVLKLGGGKLHEMPLAQLSEADQKFAREQTPAAEPEAKAATDGEKPATAKPAASNDTKPSIFKSMLAGKLVALDGKKLAKYEMAEEPKYYAFYFSAHWCPPCRAFTPKLVQFYKEQEGKKKDFEIIFVSSDRDEKSFEEYIKGDAMPWPSISFRNVSRLKEIKDYCGRGIPCLVLVDREGKVISDSYDGDNYFGPGKVMDEIPEKTRS